MREAEDQWRYRVPGSRLRPEHIAHLPLRRQQSIMNLSKGCDAELGLSVVDLEFQDALLKGVEAAVGTAREAEAVAEYNYYMFGVEEGMKVGPCPAWSSAPWCLVY